MFNEITRRIRSLLTPSTPVDEEDQVELMSEDAPTIENAAPPPATQATTSQIVKHLGGIFFSRDNMPRISIAAALTICGTGINFLSPYLFGQVVELMNSEDEKITIAGIEMNRTELMAAMMASYTVAQLLPSIREYILTPVNSRNTKKIILKNTIHLINEKSLDYHTRTPFPDMVYFMQKGFSVSAMTTPLLTQVAPTTAEIIIACSILSSRYGLEIGMGLLGLLSVYTVYSGFLAKPIIHLREESLKAGNAAYQNFCNAIAQYKNMYDFNKYNETVEGVEKALHEMITKDIAASLKPIQIGFGHTAISRIAMLIGVVFVGMNVDDEKYTTEDFIVLVGYLNSLSTLLPTFGQAINQLVAAYPDAKFVIGELLKPNEIIDPHPEVELMLNENTPPLIEFSNVTYYYKDAKKQAVEPAVMKNLSFTIQPGERVALVGESGTGKSTLLNLIYGYYQPDEGSININNQATSSLGLNKYRRHIGLIGQTPNLFKGTIRENICFGAPNSFAVTDADIMQLAASVNLSEFLREFPEGLDTDVGEAGKKLSGGQQQKVAVLRGLMKPCGIRLLDEITAPFDGQSATQVLQGLFSRNTRETTIMITHKLTENQWADRIIVLGKDYSLTSGTHKELLQSCDIYKNLWQHCIEASKHDTIVQNNQSEESSSSQFKL